MSEKRDLRCVYPIRLGKDRVFNENVPEQVRRGQAAFAAQNFFGCGAWKWKFRESYGEVEGLTPNTPRNSSTEQEPWKLWVCQGELGGRASGNCGYRPKSFNTIGLVVSSGTSICGVTIRVNKYCKERWSGAKERGLEANKDDWKAKEKWYGAKSLELLMKLSGCAEDTLNNTGSFLWIVLQNHFHCYIHCGGINKDVGSRLHLIEFHVSSRRMELARFYSSVICVRLNSDWL